jgi:hypothetical protein
MKFSDTSEAKRDVSVEVDYDVLYDFMNYVR